MFILVDVMKIDHKNAWGITLGITGIINYLTLQKVNTKLENTKIN